MKHICEKNIPHKNLLLRSVLLCCVWSLAIYLIPTLFSANKEPVYRDELINSSTYEITPPLYVGNSFSQTFQLNENYLDSAAIAFTYEEPARNSASLTVQFFLDNTLVTEQPLPLLACPLDTFLSFQLNLKECADKELTIQVTNTSENAEDTFSLLCTTNPYDYHDYSEGYALNNSAKAEGSFLCLFHYKTRYNYYKSLTYTLWILLAAIALSGFIATKPSPQLRKCH